VQKQGCKLPQEKELPGWARCIAAVRPGVLPGAWKRCFCGAAVTEGFTTPSNCANQFICITVCVTQKKDCESSAIIAERSEESAVQNR
jgi:hypothetical protein